MESKQTIIGRSVLPVDGIGKVNGKAKYLDDIELPGMLHAKILRSSHAHARIISINAEKASAISGVMSVLTAADCPDNLFGCDVADTTILPRDKVRYVGEEVDSYDLKIQEQAVEWEKWLSVYHAIGERAKVSDELGERALFILNEAAQLEGDSAEFAQEILDSVSDLSG